jgi:uncharacterized protein
MTKLLLPFWNAGEGRIRSFWRLLAQIILFLAILLFLVFAAYIAEIFIKEFHSPQITYKTMKRVIENLAELIATVLSLAIAGRWLDRRPFCDFGFHFSRRWWADFAFGLTLGAILMIAIFLFELAVGWVSITGVFVSHGNFTISILVWALIFVSVGIQEELLSRGYQLRNIAEGLNWRFIRPRTAIVISCIISSLIFGALHLANPHTSIISTANLAIAGLSIALGFILTGELAIPIGMHISWNFFQGNVFGFPVSGMAINSTFIAIRQGGPGAITGGEFGPEAGVIGLGATIIESVLIVAWVRWRYGHVAIDDRLAQFCPRKKPDAAPPVISVTEENLAPAIETYMSRLENYHPARSNPPAPFDKTD